MKHFLPALKMLIFMTFITGLIYPLIVTGIGQALFPQKANGNLIVRSGIVVGSDLIAQKFENAKYFWPRPSAIDYNPLSSGGSNQGLVSAELKKSYDERKTLLKSANSQELSDPPQDMLFASGSGLDPHISPMAAKYQTRRVAVARGMNVELVEKIVKDNTVGRSMGLFGEPTVNFFALNRALDKEQGHP